MRIALTGATGFVGRHFIRVALQRGFEIVALTRNPSRIVRDCVDTRGFSLASPPDLHDCDGVVHLAGESVMGLWTKKKKQRIRDSRVRGTQRVVEAIRALDMPPEVLVCASAVGYYGDGGETEMTERSPRGEGFLSEACAAWEAEATSAEDKCRVVRIRISSALGSDGGMLRSLRRLFRFGLGGRLGSGRQWMPWIHVDDLAALLLFAVENMDVRGPLNAAAPWPVRNAEFTRTVARLMHRPAFLHVPGFVLRLLFREFGRAMLASQRVVPAAAMDHGFAFRFPELEPAVRDALA
jgi:uncharacterized protein (TIGR01777 family)